MDSEQDTKHPRVKQVGCVNRECEYNNSYYVSGCIDPSKTLYGSCGFISSELQILKRVANL